MDLGWGGPTVTAASVSMFPSKAFFFSQEGRGELPAAAIPIPIMMGVDIAEDGGGGGVGGSGLLDLGHLVAFGPIYLIGFSLSFFSS